LTPMHLYNFTVSGYIAISNNCSTSSTWF